MSILSDAQIIALWISEGGSISSAPDALARALSESSGSTGVTSSNPDGGTNVGLYQLDTKGVGSGYTVSQLSDPYTNTKITIQATNNGQDWGEWADNWQEFTGQADSAVASFDNTASNIKALLKNVTGAGAGGAGTSGSGKGTSTGTSGTTTATPASYSSLGVGGIISETSGLFRDIAVVLDYAFGMFGRGQGWRLVFTLAAAVALLGSYKCLASAGVVPTINVPTAVPV